MKEKASKPPGLKRGGAKGCPAASTTKRARRDPSAKQEWSSFPDALVFDKKEVRFELSDTQRQLWLHHPIASQRASKFHEPLSQYRKLGVIRRRLTVKGDIGKPKIPPQIAAKKSDLSRTKKQLPSLSQSMAIKLARADAVRADVTKTDAALLVDAERIKTDWSHATKNGYMQPFWDVHGQVTHLLQDPDVLPITHLIKLLKAGKLVDDEHKNDVKTLYNGLRKVSNDTMTVLKALVELQQPEEVLYDIPIIISYPRFRDGSLEIGVYASRLLFDVMTFQSLQCIMAAFDEDSFTVTQPLADLGQCPVPVFASDARRVVFEKDDDLPDATIQDATDESGTLYAFSNAGFLRACESHGNDTSCWNELKTKLGSSLRVDLMLHQIHGLCWMHSMERIDGGLNSLLWERREFLDGGAYYYAPAFGQVRLFLGPNADEAPPIIKGGLLCDEMGLGKTIQTLALIMTTLNDLKLEARSREDHRHATLIVVPPALVSQWLSEIDKVAGDALAVEYFDHKSMKFEKKSIKRGEADIVLTTYKSFDKHAKSSADSSRVLKSSSWGRVVLDEMQEVRSSTTAIAKNCEELTCDRRWMLSGTPMFDGGVDDLRGELSFLRLEPFSGNTEDGFFKFAVQDHWDDGTQDGYETLRILSLVMLRRSKTMTMIESGLPLLGLPPLSVIYEPIPQDPSERAVYCYLESIVHASLGNDENCATNLHRSLLRLLREACMTCVMLSGGLGCPSQLAFINRLVVELIRKNLASQHTSAITPSSINTAISCDDAIRYLSQVADTARVGSGFVTEMTLGTGGGASRRDRAVDSVELQLEESQKTLVEADRSLVLHRAKRARANWQRLLELITTGHLTSDLTKTSSATFRCVWKWRFALSHHLQGDASNQSLPELLTRGWRPGVRFYSNKTSTRVQCRWQWALARVLGGYLRLERTETLSTSTRKIHATWKWRFLFTKVSRNKLILPRHEKKFVSELALKWLNGKSPSFSWAHPHCLLLSEIPPQVDDKNLYTSFASALSSTCGKVGSCLRIIRLGDAKTCSVWSAYVQFERKAHYDSVGRMLKRAGGIKVDVSHPVPNIENQLAAASASLQMAKAELEVYACATNQGKVKKAEKALRFAELGLRMFAKDKNQPQHITCAPSIHSLRDSEPKHTSSLLSRLDASIDKLARAISIAAADKLKAERQSIHFKRIIENGQASAISATSAFDSLQHLRNGNADRTQCPVCISPLGQEECSEGLVSVTPCGHLFCRGCLGSYFANHYANAPPCIACRKPLQIHEIRTVDPSASSDSDNMETRRLSAKDKIRQAAVILEQSNGLLPPDLWEALYLAIDQPLDAQRSAHSIHTAIPGLFLAHLRNATSMARDVDSHTNSTDATHLSSKIRALLADIPKDERSVVFTCSKYGVKLLVNVLNTFGVGCRCLFNGQDETTSERALEEWKQLDEVRVLVVQSGAAACGLTLTAASKMFILEPFIKHEEEKQAYARLHRYGQTKEVICKVYYTPVSVESRLLEWRKRIGGSITHTDGNILYAPLRNNISYDAQDDDVDQFLLGINHDTSISMDTFVEDEGA
ncbi:hypothetical protein MPSEU_001013100 [Mayamaea pseudoterrestris]|nr:hypothetical protein MPSEU_001013100 [Mayamaea pseudoterrestris]